MPNTQPAPASVVLAMLLGAACTHPLRLPSADGSNSPAGTGGQSGTLDAAVGETSTPTGGTDATGVASTTGGSVGGGGATSAGGWIGTGGTAGTGGTSSAGGSTCSTDRDMISDFESSPGEADTNRQDGRSGYWYVTFPGADTSSSPGRGMSQTPAARVGKPIATEIAPDASTCNQFALHSTGSGFATLDTSPAGFGAFFKPHLPFDRMGDPYDVSQHTGISFKMKSGSGTPPAVFFEVLTKENQPTFAGGTATKEVIDLNNTRGQLLNAPWTPNEISTSYQTFTVPFATLVPRWLPSSVPRHLRELVCYAGASEPKCQAPPFRPQNILGIRLSMYLDDGIPRPPGSTAGTYDLWIDDVKFVDNDAGLQTRAGFPLTNPGSFHSCIRPHGVSADSKFLVPAYNQWKATFVRDNKVIRPENKGDTLSEGIAFGMLIAVNMNDQALLDSLYGTWKGNPAAGTSMLMKSCLGGSDKTGASESCSPSNDSATGADEDVAYALLMAGKLWGGTYQADAIAMLKDLWDKDMDGADTKLPKGGSNYQSPTGTVTGQLTSASYFAPSSYRIFASVDTDASHDWAGVIAAVYKAINGPIAGSSGLIPAWCGKGCTVAASHGMSNDIYYQYDSHRIPMRVGLDYCFNGTPEAKTYTDLTTAFFARAGSQGPGFVYDMYTTTGGSVPNITTGAASVLGTAAVGAMASGSQTFLDDAYQAVFDVATRGTLAPPLVVEPDPAPESVPILPQTYGYYNATIGMLTLLIMTGNFMH